MSNEDVMIVIPAYEPDERLIQLIEGLENYPVIVVNDGSGEEFAGIFVQAEKLGAMILSYTKNQGKGYALKTAFRWVYEQKSDVKWIVTADADGQHTVSDIRKVISELNQDSDTVLKIGVRKFSGYVPLRSRLGNRVSTWIFEKVTGLMLTDTQSGLRVYNSDYLSSFIQIHGERYEYELNCLFFCAKEKFQMEQTVIHTIYEENNTSSHFRVVVDTLKICKVMINNIYTPL